jgi:hypothetical protein
LAIVLLDFTHFLKHTGQHRQAHLLDKHASQPPFQGDSLAYIVAPDYPTDPTRHTAAAVAAATASQHGPYAYVCNIHGATKHMAQPTQTAEEPLTPVKAVPAMNQAKGSRYHGDTLIRYRLAATLVKVMATALQALMGLISNTCAGSRNE